MSPAIAASPDPKRPATIYAHPRSVVHLVHPVTGESVDAAKEAALKERIALEATRRACWDGVDLRTAPSQVRVAYLDKAAVFLEPIRGLQL